jgi:hypothetical protein
MRFFVPSLERVLKVVVGVTLLLAIAVPVAWGYEQRQRALAWQDTACVYRLREVIRNTSLQVVPSRRGSACAVLNQLGLEIERTSRLP